MNGRVVIIIELPSTSMYSISTTDVVKILLKSGSPLSSGRVI